MRNLFLSMLLISSLGASAQFSGKGSGTADDPYQITNADELYEVRNKLDASYKLMNDIDLTEWIQENNPNQGWSPIGAFSGTFNGNGMTIKGLFIKRPSLDNVGLFSQLSYTCVVENLCLYNPVITAKDYVGALAGISNGNINNGDLKSATICNVCIIEPVIQGQTYVGGLVGGSERTQMVDNTVVFPKIVANSYIGGLVGRHYGYNSDTFSVRGSVNNNVISGGIISGQSEIGGVIGYAMGNSNYTIAYNFCSSNLNGQEYVGGICGKLEATCCTGYLYNGTSNPSSWTRNCSYAVSNNHFSGRIAGSQYVGGIVGGLYGCYETGGKFVTYKPFTAKLNINVFCNICSGKVFANEDASGVLGDIPTKIYGSDMNRSVEGMSTDKLENNVFCGDTVSSSYIDTHLYRISCHNGTNNYALSTTTMLLDGKDFLLEEDDDQQGIGIGKKILMKQSTYEGLGFNFTKQWAIVEGETYPYNINQCRPATITEFKSGSSAKISGTAIGKSSQCNGSVYVMVGDAFYEGTVSKGQWTVALGEVAKGEEAKVTVMVDGMMPSILVTAVAGEAATPDDDDPSTDPEYIPGETKSVTLTANMTTLYTSKGLDFTGVAGLKAYIAKGFDAETGVLTMTPVDKVPAGTALVLVGAAGTYEVPCAKSSGVYVNLLNGVSEDVTLPQTDGANTNYVLTNVKGFDRVDGDIQLTAGAAYLSLPSKLAKNTPVVTLHFENVADVNGDGVVDVEDVVAVVNIILNGGQ
jgi:hypothetical protein